MALAGPSERMYDSPSADSGGGSLPHMTQLDGLRGLAVCGVMLNHFVPESETFPVGELGVKLFFVLSGFLITGILLNCRHVRAGIGQSLGFTLRQFYVRRALRIFPVYYAALAALYMTNVGRTRADIGWHLLYLTNIHDAIHLKFPSGMAHFWTLSVEEQFYLAWPLLILLTPRKWLAPAVLAAAAVGPAYRVWSFQRWWLAPGDVWIRMVTPMPASLDSLALGALLAVCRDRADPRPVLGRWLDRTALWVGVPCTLVLLLVRYCLFNGQLELLHLDAARWVDPVLLAQRMLFVMSTMFALAMALACVWVVGKAARGFKGDLGAFLSMRTLVYLGGVSYGVYVWHYPLLIPMGMLFQKLGGRQPPPALWFLVMFATTTAAATASWYLLERPLNSLKRYFPYSQPASEVAPVAIGGEIDGAPHAGLQPASR